MAKGCGGRIDHPAHYNAGNIECIDALRACMTHEQFCGFLKGNVMKYCWRAGLKGAATEDLEKARWYQERLIAEMRQQYNET
ncbi:hypothetical protein BEE12_16140 [Pantoea agglomerans]|uniref:DUF3310 domain-containing protein n=1 Tax=Enterobacter agglomerans TaxID=549 RepID=UPI00083DB27F|nr:DUF3310 domain-containing protein [Pantoea agglomerans]AOE41247.1 hypothetical protein BEE12_16140 [Pantoea agglomerans]